MQVVDSEGYLKVKLVGGPVGPFVPYTGATANVDLGTHTIIAQNATISSSGSGNTATITHSSGSGIGLSITKGGNGEGLYVNKTSGSGNAVTVIGDVQATILKITGGTSSQFLKADGSVDSTTYISGITIGTTAITSGTVGRILFEGTGNVVQESANLFWDNTNGRLGIGTSVPARALDIVKTIASGALEGIKIEVNHSSSTSAAILDFIHTQFDARCRIQSIAGAGGANPTLSFIVRSTTAMSILQSGNVNIGNTTTDAGFRLDVNGTARVSGTVTLNNTSGTNRSTDLRTSNSIDNFPTTTFYPSSGTNVGQSFQVIPRGTGFSAGIKAQFAISGTDTIADGTNFEAMVVRATGSAFTFSSGKGGTGTIRPMLFSSGFLDGVTNPNQLWLYTTGNVGINTTTDAGFRLDVNGDTILRRVTFITPNTITGGTEFFRVKSGNWPTSLIQGYENGVLNLGSSSGSIGFKNQNFSLPVGSYFSFNYVPANILNTYAFLLTANYTNVGAGGTSQGTMLRTTGSTSTSVGNVTMNQIEMMPTYNNTGGTTINRGFYYNPTLTSLTNTTHWAIHTTSGRVRFEGLPTSPAGLSSGDVWNNLGILTIV